MNFGYFAMIVLDLYRTCKQMIIQYTLHTLRIILLSDVKRVMGIGLYHSETKIKLRKGSKDIYAWPIDRDRL